MIFATHCLPRALSLSPQHILIYLNFLPRYLSLYARLSLCLRVCVCVFEADKARAFDCSVMDDFAEWKMTGYFLEVYHGGGGGSRSSFSVSQRGSEEQKRSSGDLVLTGRVSRGFFFFALSLSLDLTQRRSTSLYKSSPSPAI